jgi:phosphotransferase system HPr (HPr) family protein
MSDQSNQPRRLPIEDEMRSGSSPPHVPVGTEHGDGPSARSHTPDHHARRFTIVAERGLHVRAAARLVLVASRFPCVVTVRHHEAAANAKSVMELLLLRATCGSTIDVVATGKDAGECMNAIEALVANRFDDPI